jgi:DNA-binding beta-propeller fold protein YncE
MANINLGTVKIEMGDRHYELVQGWGEMPSGWEWGQVGAVATDSDDNVHIFTRAEHPYRVFDKDGKLLDHWGEEIFMDAHGICIMPDDTIYFVDRFPQLVFKFDKSGRHRLTLGKRDQHSDTGYTQEGREPSGPHLLPHYRNAGKDASGGGMPTTNGVAHGAGPFYHPTDVCADEPGNIWISDGYRNSRVHKFSPSGELLMSFGDPGNASELRDTTNQPGRFHTVHGIWAWKGKVYVADRENNRIQVYTDDGQHLAIWPRFERPTKLYVEPKEELLYVSELEDQISIVDLDGNLVGRYGSERSHDPGKFWGPHGIWCDSEGSIYVAEVLNGARLQKFARVS